MSVEGWWLDETNGKWQWHPGSFQGSLRTNSAHFKGSKFRDQSLGIQGHKISALTRLLLLERFRFHLMFLWTNQEEKKQAETPKVLLGVGLLTFSPWLSRWRIEETFQEPFSPCRLEIGSFITHSAPILPPSWHLDLSGMCSTSSSQKRKPSFSQWEETSQMPLKLTVAPFYMPMFFF